MRGKIAIFWFRRDLRLEDNVGLHQALKAGIMMDEHKIQLNTFLKNANADVDAAHDEIADGINRGSELAEKAAEDADTLDVALLFRSIVSMNYFVTAFSNHAISAKTLAPDEQQAIAFEKMAGEHKQYIDQYVTLSKSMLFPKFT